MGYEDQALDQLERIYKKIEQLQFEHHHLMETVKTLLYQTEEVRSGVYQAEFGPVTYSILTRMTGYNANERTNDEDKSKNV